MRKNLMPLVCIGLTLLAWLPFAQAQCPEDPNDPGTCDTMYVQVYDHDELFAGQPKQVRVAIRVTADVPDPQLDSIGAFQIPLCFTSSFLAARCVAEPEYNKCGSADLYPFPDLDGSIFRHLPSMEDPQEHNWMMDLSEQMLGLEWGTRILDLSEGDNLWLVLAATGPGVQFFGEGSRILVATITFTVHDTTTICLDTCFWPPWNELLFSNGWGTVLYVPRTNLPYCVSMRYPKVGDCNANGVIDLGDVVYLVRYLYRGGPFPATLEAGDTNCDGVLGVGDVIRLIGYLYEDELPPACWK